MVEEEEHDHRVVQHERELCSNCGTITSATTVTGTVARMQIPNAATLKGDSSVLTTYALP
jgi:hypothetical protein